MSEKNIVIFGVGIYGRAVYRKIKKLPDRYNIIAFIDNDTSKNNTSFDDVSIHSPEDIKLLEYDEIFLAGRFVTEQEKQLVDELGIDQSKIKLFKKSDLTPGPKEVKARSDSIDHFLEIFSDIAKSKQMPYWMDHSALLGIIRGEDLSRFSDVDIALISAQDANSLWSELKKSKIIETFNISRTFVSEGEVSSKHMDVGTTRKVLAESKVSVVEQEPAIIDINIRTKIGEDLYYAINAKEAKTPYSYFDGHDIATYNSIELRIPKNAEEYLELLYGENWRTPAEFFSDSQFEVITD